MRHLFFVSVTGLATPSIDARLVNRIGLRTDVKRTPIFGLGCVAGAAGIARAADSLRAFPDEVAVLLSVELCSLTLQRGDLSIPNLIATGLFGDGAAAVVLTARRIRRRGPRVVATRSVFYPGTEHVMGWEIGSDGFRVVLSGDVPRVARGIRKDVDEFLAAGASRSPTSPPSSVIRADRGCSRRSRRRSSSRRGARAQLEEPARGRKPLECVGAHRARGNARRSRAPPGSHGLLLAMGPGFCSELVLLQW